MRNFNGLRTSRGTAGTFKADQVDDILAATVPYIALAGGPNHAEHPNNGKKAAKELVCHVPDDGGVARTINVSGNSLAAKHLAHGDTAGDWLS